MSSSGTEPGVLFTLIGESGKILVPVEYLPGVWFVCEIGNILQYMLHMNPITIGPSRVPQDTVELVISRILSASCVYFSLSHHSCVDLM